MNPLHLDIGTVISLLVVGNLAALAILLAYRSPGTPAKPVRHFALGKSLQALAWVLLRLRGLVPDIYSVQVGNAALLAGLAFECLAVATVDGPDGMRERAFGALALAGIACSLAFSGTPNARVAAVSLASIGPYAALAVFVRREGLRSGLRYFIVVGSAVYCLILAFRAASAFAMGGSFDLMTPALVQTLAFVPQYTSLIVSTIAFILLLKERGDTLLLESEDKYRKLVEKASEAIIITQDGCFAYANPRMAEIAGVSPEELEGRPFAPFICPEDRDRVMAIYQARLDRKGPPESYDYRFLRPDGTRIWVSITATLIEWGGRPATLCLLTTIEERKRSEERVAALLRDKELLLGEVHHRIKNSLAIAASLLSLQSEDSYGRPAEEILLDARNRLQTMARLYERLHLTGDFEAMSARDYLLPLVEEISAAFPRSSKLRIELEIEDLVLDPNRLSSLGIMINEIVTNSIKHAFDGVADPLIRVGVSSSGGRVRVSCGDNGRSLPQGAEHAEGNGFGLKLIGMMAERLGAELRVEREGGTTYHIEFDARSEASRGQEPRAEL